MDPGPIRQIKSYPRRRAHMYSGRGFGNKEMFWTDSRYLLLDNVS